jgi:membrane-bound lytic murein transglycosylase D
MQIRGNRKSRGFGRKQAASLAVAGMLGSAAVAGTMRGGGAEAIDPLTGVSPSAAVTAESAPLAGAEWDLPNLDHERIDFWVNLFTTERRDQFEGFLQRSGRYVPMISQKLEERGMPQDLIYLAMIESGFEAQAYSHAHASGIWQFIEETGRRYGLEINRAVDERNDPVKATDAALDYMTYLYNRFDSWYLASAAYNTGENRVGRIMREETGSERGSEESYYDIWHRLPRETRDYVPLMIAAARISKEPAKYGFENVVIDEPLRYEEVVIDPGTPLRAIAEAAGITVDDVKEFNPQLRIDRTRNDRRSVLKIPEGTRTAFLVNWPNVREQRTLAATPYRVRQGDSLLGIARQHGVSVNALRSENNLRNDFIRAGQTLDIPGAR